MNGSALIDIVHRVLSWLRAGVPVRKDPTNLMPVLPGQWVQNMDGRHLLSTPPGAVGSDPSGGLFGSVKPKAVFSGGTPRI